MNRLLQLMIFTLRNPEAGFSTLRSLRLEMSERWAMLVLSGAVSAILSWLAARDPGQANDPLSRLALHPITLASLQVAAAAMLAILLYRVGRMFGGRGSFPDAVLAVGWLELVMLAVQLPQLVLAYISPGLAAMIGLLTFFLYIYLAIEFTRALHGFSNRVMIFLAMAGTVFAAGIALSLFAAMLGLMPEVTP